ADLADVLGMYLDLFTRVLLLPQGDFAGFLRSMANDRLDLLQKLFGTQLFQAEEHHHAQRASVAARAEQENPSELKMLLDRD
ncbi:hypothetical protein, partial [Paenarthrobacter aurescens]|uniref:hypothetical protein n=1 Tax=Paenarthrobacter aurescens TaxID=43663 RepID=UPI0021BF12B3